MGFRYAQPDNEHDFQTFCVRLYRKIWKNENLQPYGKRGEAQNGIDIFDPQCLKPVRVIQCKHHEPTKTIPPQEIKDEVRKAEASRIPIEEFVIATTAKKSRTAQDTVVELNLRKNKQFIVLLHFWEEICEQLSQLSTIQSYFILHDRDAASDFLSTLMHDPQIAGIASQYLGTTVVSDISEETFEIEQLIDNRIFDVAEYELSRLTKSAPNEHRSPKEQYALLRLKAKLEFEKGNFQEAGNAFLNAFDLHPDLAAR